jgi:hypothetical protein
VAVYIAYKAAYVALDQAIRRWLNRVPDKPPAKTDDKADNKLDDSTWEFRQKLNDAWLGLWNVLDQLSDGQELGVDLSRCQEARELLPLAMLGFVVRAQGRATPEQQRYLKGMCEILQCRYTAETFIKLFVEEEPSDWERLCGLDDEYCGQVWKTVIELLCRTRQTELTAPFAENLQALATYFYQLGQPWSEDINTLVRKKFDAFEYHAAALQKEVPLRLIMALQDALARRLGGQSADYVLDEGETEFLNGCAGMSFMVHNDDFGQMPRFFWVNKFTEQVWNRYPAATRCRWMG